MAPAQGAVRDAGGKVGTEARDDENDESAKLAAALSEFGGVVRIASPLLGALCVSWSPMWTMVKARAERRGGGRLGAIKRAHTATELRLRKKPVYIKLAGGGSLPSAAYPPVASLCSPKPSTTTQHT